MNSTERKTIDFTPEERATLLRQFHSSGLKYAEFAREHNINANCLKNWLWIEARPDVAHKRYSATEKKKILESFLSSGMTKDQFAKTWGVSSGTLIEWLRRYEEQGSDGLMNKPRGKNDKRLGSKIPMTVQSEIISIKKKEPTYGIKKIKHWLYRFRGVKVSANSVRKTVVNEGLPLVVKKKKKKRSSEKVRRFERAKPMQLWQSDITQFILGSHSMRVYLTVFMDDHSRYIVGWRLQTRQTADLVMDAFKDAMVRFGKPQEVLTDQGRQYFAWRGKSELEKYLEKEGIKHVVSRAHHPQTLGKCERFWETVSNEFWTRAKPQDLEEARARLKYFIDHYNHQRPHQGLDGQVPADRFFGIAAEVREAVEKSVVENSLRLSLGELPKPPAFLIGQVGEQRIAFHGTTGSFILTHENLKEEHNARSVNESIIRSESTADERPELNEKLSAPINETSVTEDIAIDTDSQNLGRSDNGRTWTSPGEGCNYNAVLDGSVDEARCGDQVELEVDSLLANESASNPWHEHGTFNTTTNQIGG